MRRGKPLSAEYYREYRKARPEVCRAAGQRYYRAHPEVASAWREANPEKVRITNRRKCEKYRRANLDRQRERQRLWHRANPTLHTVYNQRYRAKLWDQDTAITRHEWEALIASYCGLCVYCGQPRKPTMDHIEPVSKGGEHGVENVVPACRRCNSSKSGKSLIVWLAGRCAV